MGETVKHFTHVRHKTQRASPAYLATSDTPSTKCVNSCRHLIILDLNGALVSKTGKSGMWVRPHYMEFLEYLFSQFEVGVWSSARRHTVSNMCQLFGDFKKQLLFTWSRENFGLSDEEYLRNTPTIKDLQLVWKNLDVNSSLTKYTACNTILLDDSASKAVLQPFNSIAISEFDHKCTNIIQNGDNELLNVIAYLEKVKYEDNVSNFMKRNPYYQESLSSETSECDFQSTHFRYSDAKQTIGDLRNTAGLSNDGLSRRRTQDKKRPGHRRYRKSKQTPSKIA
ncbi:HAD-like domain-containing protein [Umbelopsis sp. PMI_123]|nr:HAD-like domain-containing protein [Umbelopsis sp. PMI_123]